MTYRNEDSLSPRQVEFEDQRVRSVLEAFRLIEHVGPLLDDCEAREGRPRLSFESFRKCFPAFPVVLEARHTGGVAERCPPASLFRRFETLFFLDYYLEAYARLSEEAEGRPVGLVVPFDGYRGAMVVHDGDFGNRATKISHPVANDLPPHRVTVEPFHGLIRHLARGPWTPETPLPGGAAANGPEVSRELTFTPWMVQAVGDGPALVVLAWARKVLRWGSGYDRCFVRRVGEAGRCLMASHEQVAAETGLSARQVSRGLAGLKRAGLIEPVGRTTRTGWSLSSQALLGSSEAGDDPVG